MSNKKLNQKKIYTSETEMGINYIKIILIILVIVCVFSLITSFVTNKKNNKTNSNEVTIQYKEIIAGNILNVSNDEYYVLIEFENDNYNTLYETYLTNYASKEKALPYYKVDMSKGFNKSYISTDKPNLDTDISSELKFTETTLLKIKSKKIVEKYYTNDAIIKALEQL
jgi:hypothetical protein